MPLKTVYNSFGEVVERGRYLHGKLNGEGIRFNKKWFKSPHFYNGVINGLYCTYDDEGTVDFYGTLKDGISKECLEFHPLLLKEYEYMLHIKTLQQSIVDFLYT